MLSDWSILYTKSPHADAGAHRLQNRVLGTAGFMYVSSAYPGPYPDVVQYPDVSLHVFALAYLTLALVLAYFDIDRILPTAGARILWIPCAWMFFYSVALELAQAFIPERQAETLVLLWDAIGIGLGRVCYRGYAGIRRVGADKVV